MNKIAWLVVSVRESDSFLKRCAQEKVVYVHLFDYLRRVPQKFWISSTCPISRPGHQNETARLGPGSLR
ncbi:uncharacterized protein METZ01_LOCUS142754 [marine metagenome]|uniref:Uncharacterized protein n=1 Tax=marine metagenome TaxID=408172 RepID=A0A381ZKX6_9ZZZZ